MLIFKLKVKFKNLQKQKNLDNPKEIKKLEKIMETEIEKKATTLIKRFIKKDTDPIGLRKLGRTHVRKWNSQEWEESYKHLRFRVTADVKVTQSGVTE